jgi:two-component system CheB/CheR fusion protein
MAFVLVQHLEPKHKSMLADILSRQTSLSIVEATNDIAIEKNHIYVIPPNANISISKNKLRITKRGRRFSEKHLPINSFLISLANEKKEKAISVILSGTGADGSEGTKAVKTGGGITFAQNEDTAAYYTMPYNAVKTGAVDFVLSPKDIAAKLYGVSKNPSKTSRQIPPIRSEKSADYLANIFELLKTKTGVDFTHYRRTTISRRLERRMSYYKLSNYKFYYEKLKSDPSELDTLYKDLLISVTSFFRDPASFTALRKKILSLLVKNRSAKEPVRVWVPGCSTGQEVYSLAITIYDFLEEMRLKIPVQVFGTDLNDALISRARSGVYPKAAVSGVPHSYLERYFTKAGVDNYRINKNIRDFCVFARHNVIKDPPLSKMDIVSFRNVMIYLEPFLQKKVINMLLYALKPGGFIILGQSESLGAFPDLFHLVDDRHKIYSKVSSAKKARLEIETDAHLEKNDVSGWIDNMNKRTDNMAKPLEKHAGFEREVDELFLSKYRPAGVLVNEALEVVQTRGDTSLYIKMTPGKASLNILNIVRDELKIELYEVIHKAKRESRSISKEDIQIKFLNKYYAIDFEVTPARIENEDYSLIMFEQAQNVPENDSGIGAVPGKAVNVKEINRMRQELRSTKTFLHSVIAEKENNNEELRAAIEEVQSSNEELQTLNEEIETGKEELESTNEELVTLNEELQNRNLELIQTNSDLSNLITNISLPVVILDKNLRIRRLTPLTKNVMNVVQSDVGRPVSQIKLKVDMPDLEKLVNSVIRNSKTTEREAVDIRGRWYSVRISPYVGPDNRNDGAVVTFIDITALRQIQEDLRRSLDYSQGIVETMNEPLVVLDKDMHIVSANANFYKTFRVIKSETENKRIYKIGNGQWNIPALRKLLEDILPDKTSFNNYEVTHDFPGIGNRTISLNARQILDESKKKKLILLAMLDITRIKMAEQSLKRDNDTFRRLVEERSDALLHSQQEVDALKRLSDLGEIAATVAHELRNPLAAINTAVYNLQRKTHDTGLAGHFDTITKKIAESSTIINNLLRFSNTKLPTYDTVHIYDVIKECMELEKQKHIKQNTRVVGVFEPLKKVSMDADPVQIRELVTNIIDNAYDAIPENGVIEVIGKTDKQHLRLSIKDNGTGIDKENMEKLFRPFFSTKAKGTGLGLAVCLQIARLHNGTIEVNSKKGKGSTFTITLPLKRP